ncbi:hypothetical protein EJ03DRAFT_372852 [Teratosphaeria nubilosa]|uniref:Hydrophobic surface binding protein A n=1 Tax=Teratosphaeria nubilosa TaxID=161662 RepID=A0A6G1LEY6_9PEZI|nr:hypothetical protein EJ03DRAFT_372852 [Teratosphaeria nubilosa]
MVAITLLILLAASVSQAAVIIREPVPQSVGADGGDASSTKPTILTDLKSIDADVEATTQKIEEFQGNSPKAILPVVVARNHLDHTIQQAIGHASFYDKLSDADATTGVNFLTGTLEPSIAAHIKALEEKKPIFVVAKSTNTIALSLTDLKKELDNLFDALKSDFPDSQQQAYQDAAKKIDDDVQEGITSFGGSTAGAPGGRK